MNVTATEHTLVTIRHDERIPAGRMTDLIITGFRGF
jgi:hypothetical protein